MRNLTILSAAILLGVVASLSYDTKPSYAQFKSRIPLSSMWDSNLKAPYETNSFFQNMVVKSGNLPIDVVPYLVKIEARSQGLGISQITKNRINKWNVTTVFDLDWAITPDSEKFDSHKVVKYDKLSVTIKSTYKSGSMTFPLVRGNAYISMIVDDLAPIFYTPRGIVNVTDASGQEVVKFGTSEKFVVTLTGGHKWVIYVHESTKVLRTTSQIWFQSHIKGNIRLAYIGTDESALPIYDKYSDPIPTGGGINYRIKGPRGLIQFLFTRISLKGTSATGNPLIFGLPHHMEVLQNPTVENVKFYTIKGNVTAIGDSSWLMLEKLTTITWQDPTHPVKPEWKEATRAALISDTNYYADASRNIEVEAYKFGVQIMRLARLALIADYLNEKSSGDKARAAIKRLIIPWLDSSNTNKLHYDTVYGGLITDLNVNDKVENAINGRYDNHHHQYGYQVYAAAVLAKEDVDFLNKYKDQLLVFVRDYANPSQTDPYFPYARHKDWYNGHSWSGGLAEYDDNRNEQSVSQALNSYYAIVLLGEALKDQALKDWGRLLAATEMHSAKKYWQMPDDSVYPAVFAQNRMVGDLWSTKADYRTWFGPNVEYIHAIHMLPFTPITYDLLSYQYVKTEYPVFAKANTQGEWLSYQIMVQAVLDPNAAWTRANTTTITNFGRNSRANMLWWIISRIDQKAIAEAKRKAEEAKKKAEEEAKRKAEEAKKKAEEEAKRKAEEAKKKAEEEAKKKAEEAKKKAEEEAKKRAEEGEHDKEEGDQDDENEHEDESLSKGGQEGVVDHVLHHIRPHRIHRHQDHHGHHDRHNRGHHHSQHHRQKHERDDD